MTDRRTDPLDETEDAVSLRPVFQMLWGYRRAILLTLVAVALAYVVGVVALYATTPRERLATLGFRLTFEGAERNEFPNRTKFSTAEIVSTAVLAEVFKTNKLEQYVEFANFKDALFVLQANPDLEMLAYEYQTKLADTRLTPVDRSRIEAEYRTKRDSIKSAEYSLNIRRQERLVSIPTPVLGKILEDTLSTWAKQAAERKGAIRYDIPVLTKAVLKKDVLAAEDYVVAADMLRNKIEQILKTVDLIAEIPGSSALRVTQDQIGLTDVRATLEDLRRFRIEPLIGLIQGYGLSRNAVRMEQYFEERLFDVQLVREETSRRIKAMQDAMSAYTQRPTTNTVVPAEPGRAPGPSVTPQVTESFIDKLVELSTQPTDMKYRQDMTDRIMEEGLKLAELNRQTEYYDSMRKSFAAAKKGATTNSAIEAEVRQRTNAAADEVMHAMELVQSIYKVAAEQNLNPNTQLYSPTTPLVVRTSSSIVARTVVLYFALTMFLAALVTPVVCLIHNYYRQWISPAPVARASRPRDAKVG